MKKRKRDEKPKDEIVCLPGQAIMEIKDVLYVCTATGKTELTDEAVNKGKEWTEFTKL